MKFEMVMQKVTRIHPVQISLRNPSPRIQLIRQQFRTAVNVFFTNTQFACAKAAERKAIEFTKAAADDDKKTDDILKAVLAVIIWEALVDTVIADLAAAAQTGGIDGLTQLEITSKIAQDAIDDVAADYASKRSAEMVGMKWAADQLVDNPTAIFSIAATTEDDLRDIIAMGVKSNLSPADLAYKIQTAPTFDKARGELISKTEIAMAQVAGNLAVWKSSGLVKKVAIILSDDHTVEDECDIIAKGGPYEIERLPLIPFHPNCMCGYLAVEVI